MVHFTASWCIPSVAMNPFFGELASNYPDALFLTVDVDDVKVSPPSFFFLEISLETVHCHGVWSGRTNCIESFILYYSKLKYKATGTNI